MTEDQVAVDVGGDARPYYTGEQGRGGRSADLLREQARSYGGDACDDHGDAAEAVGEPPVLVVVQRPGRLASKRVVALDLGQVVAEQDEPDSHDDADEDADGAAVLRDDTEDG